MPRSIAAAIDSDLSGTYGQANVTAARVYVLQNERFARLICNNMDFRDHKVSNNLFVPTPRAQVQNSHSHNHGIVAGLMASHVPQRNIHSSPVSPLNPSEMHGSPWRNSYTGFYQHLLEVLYTETDCHSAKPACGQTQPPDSQ